MVCMGTVNNSNKMTVNNRVDNMVCMGTVNNSNKMRSGQHGVHGYSQQ